MGGAKNISSLLIATTPQFLRLLRTGTFNVESARTVSLPSRLTWADEVELGAPSPIFIHLEWGAAMMTDHGNGLAAVAWCPDYEDIDDFPYLGNST